MARRTDAEAREDEVREIQIAAHHENIVNVPVGVDAEAIGTTPSGKKEKVLGFHALAQEVIVTLDGKEILRLNSEQFRSVQRAVSAAGAGL
jgi:hypothetical protein